MCFPSTTRRRRSGARTFVVVGAGRDPVGDGWLYMNRDGYMWQLSSGAAGVGNSGTWTRKAQLPQNVRDCFNPAIRGTSAAFDYILIPLDAYGCIWIIGNNWGRADRCWLYKP